MESGGDAISSAALEGTVTGRADIGAVADAESVNRTLDNESG